MSSEAPLYERDPDAWRAYLAEGNRTQARKRVSADVLFCDADGRILLVDPVYKPGWDFPGGMAEANESPASAAGREIREELGIVRAVDRLLVVDWVAPHGPWDDLIAFVFDGGMLSEGDLAGIRLGDGELRAYRTGPAAPEAGARLPGKRRHRLSARRFVKAGHAHSPRVDEQRSRTVTVSGSPARGPGRLISRRRQATPDFQVIGVSERRETPITWKSSGSRRQGAVTHGRRSPVAGCGWRR